MEGLVSSHLFQHCRETKASERVILALVHRKREESPNENKMSDGGRGRASLGVEVCKSSEM